MILDLHYKIPEWTSHVSHPSSAIPNQRWIPLMNYGRMAIEGRLGIICRAFSSLDFPLGRSFSYKASRRLCCRFCSAAAQDRRH